jgi:peptidoglycan/LPS O-acetylase OafA/YrhL
MLRFVLALMVVFAHLSSHRLFQFFGLYAVMGFYVVSGYVMTAVLNLTYQFDGKRFWINRFLRLFPVYYAVALLTALLVLLFPEQAGVYHHAWRQFSWSDLAGQLLLVPYAFREHDFRIVPPTWSVGVELVNYFLLWLVIARSARFAWSALVISGAYHLYCLTGTLDLPPRYYPFYAAVFPFSIGALVFFLKPKVSHDAVALAAVLFAMNMLLIGLLDRPLYTNLIGWYLNIALITAMLAGLAPLKANGTDKMLGDLAYPIFLVHRTVGFVVVLLTGVKSPLLPSLIPILLLSALFAWGSNKFIEPKRSQIRNYPARSTHKLAKAPVDPRSPVTFSAHEGLCVGHGADPPYRQPDRVIAICIQIVATYLASVRHLLLRASLSYRNGQGRIPE